MLHYYIQKGHRIQDLMDLTLLEKEFYMASMEFQYEINYKEIEKLKKKER